MVTARLHRMMRHSSFDSLAIIVLRSRRALEDGKEVGIGKPRVPKTVLRLPDLD
jgi:hypothetical protein